MPYEAGISRNNPTFFLFMIDQSRSMTEEVSAGDEPQEKAAGVAASINRWLHELSVKCAKTDGVRDYYSVGVIGYGKKVGSAFAGKLAKQEVVPISAIAEHPIRLVERTRKVPDGSGGFNETQVKVPIWFDPVANGATPMCKAADAGHRLLTQWLGEHPDCYPPIVINVTDGEATDGEPSSRLKGLTGLSSSDGNVMLFNIHLSANEKAKPIVFPDSADNLPDDYARMLFESSSLLTPRMRAIAKEHGIPTTEGSRAFVLNADMVLLVQAIDIGTRPADLRMEDPTSSADRVDRGLKTAGVEPEGPAPSTEDAPAAADDAERLPDGVPYQGSEAGDAGGDQEPDGVPYRASDAGAGAAAAAPAEAKAQAKEEEEKMTVVLTTEDTQEVVDCKIKLNRAGCVTKVIPYQPLDPKRGYRLHSVPASSLAR